MASAIDPSGLNPASFWSRFKAACIDGGLLLVAVLIAVGGLAFIFPNDVAFPFFTTELTQELTRDETQDGETTRVVTTSRVWAYDIRGLLVSDCIVKEDSTQADSITVTRTESLECSASAYDLTEITLLVMIILYGTYFEMGPRSATIGKRVAGILVTRMDGQPLTFWRALARNAAEFLSWILLIGYVLALFTKRRRALHDIIAGTMVVWKPLPGDEREPAPIGPEGSVRQPPDPAVKRSDT